MDWNVAIAAFVPVVLYGLVFLRPARIKLKRLARLVYEQTKGEPEWLYRTTRRYVNRTGQVKTLIVKSPHLSTSGGVLQLRIEYEHGYRVCVYVDGEEKYPGGWYWPGWFTWPRRVFHIVEDVDSPVAVAEIRERLLTELAPASTTLPNKGDGKVSLSEENADV